jgi:hypothetical protein
MLLPEASFAALRELLLGSDFARTRPYRAATAPVDYIQSAREEGATFVQDFHAGYTRRGGRLYAILADVCAFANTNGGTIYVGASGNPKERPVGVSEPDQVMRTLQTEIERRITPPLEVELDRQKTQGVDVLRIAVPRGDDPPYAIDDNKIYIRSESETGLAVRDEIVSLVTRALHEHDSSLPSASVSHVDPPRTGVEVVRSEERKGTHYHSLRDLRNGNVVKNVTRKSARRLWHYAIVQVEDHPLDESKIEWQGDVASLGQRVHAGTTRYDLVQRETDGIRRYYGVTEDGIHGVWAELLGLEADD